MKALSLKKDRGMIVILLLAIVGALITHFSVDAENTANIRTDCYYSGILMTAIRNHGEERITYYLPDPTLIYNGGISARIGDQTVRLVEFREDGIYLLQKNETPWDHVTFTNIHYDRRRSRASMTKKQLAAYRAVLFNPNDWQQ